MTRYYPLIKHQFKNMKLLFLLLPFLISWFALSVVSKMNSIYHQTAFDLSYYKYGNLFYSSIDFRFLMVLGIGWGALVCAAQSYYEKKPSVANFISSLPYKRVTVVGIRILTTVCIYTVCLFILGVVLLVMRESNFELFIGELYSTVTGGSLFFSYDTPNMIVKSLFAVWIGITVFYLSSTLSQMVVSNLFIAGAIGLITPMFPFYFVRYFHNLLYNAFGYTSSFLHTLSSKLMMFEAMFLGSDWHTIYFTSGLDTASIRQPLNGMLPVRLSTYQINIVTTASILYLAVMIACAVIILAASLFVYSKLVCYANYGDFIAFRKASAAFAFFGGLCCALLGSNFFRGAIITLLVFVVIFVVSYIVFSKVAERGGARREKKSAKK